MPISVPRDVPAALPVEPPRLPLQVAEPLLVERVVRLARLAEAHRRHLLPAAGREGHGGLVGAGDGVVAAGGVVVLRLREREGGMEEGGGGSGVEKKERERARSGSSFFFLPTFSILSKFSSKNKKDALDPVGPHLDAADPPREHVEEHGDL